MNDWYFPCALAGASWCVTGFNMHNDILLYSGAFMCMINSYCHFEYSK